MLGPTTGALDVAWPQLAHPDRFVRAAARTVIERQPVDQWRARALAEPDAQSRVQALIALARTGTQADTRAWLDSLLGLSFADAIRDQRLDLLRAAALGVIRFDPLADDARQRLVTTYSPLYPTGEHVVDRELANLLVRLAAPDMITRLLESLARAATQEEAIDVAMTLSTISTGWTIPQRTQLLDWFDKAASIGGGRSSFGYVAAARTRFIQRFGPSDRAALQDRVSKPLVPTTPQAVTASRPLVKEWKLDELVAAAAADAGPRDFDNGRRMFSAATCYNCHRIAGEGSSVGPDLTGVGRRFGVPDILRAIVEPDHEISDQYRQMVFETNGRMVIGRVTNLNADAVLVSTDMLDPKKEISIRRDEIDEQYPSETSTMPGGLLNTLSESEVLDLLAYLRAGGAPPAASP
jgi:putative heme-binding domain-containing protein